MVLDNGFPAGDYLFTVHRQRRNRARAGSGGDDHVFRLDPPPVRGNLHLVARCEAPGPHNVFHVVFAQQVGDSPGIALDHIPASPHRYAIIGLEVVETKAKFIPAAEVGHYLRIPQ